MGPARPHDLDGHIETPGSNCLKTDLASEKGYSDVFKSALPLIFIVSKHIPGICAGWELSRTEANEAGSVFLAKLLLLWQEFRLDLLELYYCRFLLLGRDSYQMKILMISPQPFFEPRGTPISVYQRLEALSRPWT